MRDSWVVALIAAMAAISKTGWDCYVLAGVAALIAVTELVSQLKNGKRR